jgi:hypothetical protein
VKSFGLTPIPPVVQVEAVAAKKRIPMDDEPITRTELDALMRSLEELRRGEYLTLAESEAASMAGRRATQRPSRRRAAS